MPTVIREEQDDGVIGKPQFLQFAKNRAHAVVGALDHGRIGRVLMSLGRFLGFVLFLKLWLGLNRSMNRVMGQIEKERLVFVLFDKLTGFNTKPIGQVLALFLLLEIGILVGTVIASSTWTPP